MTTVTDDGLEWWGDKSIDNVSTRLDAIAVGTGTNEATGASTLGSEAYRSNYTNSNVQFVETGATGEYEAIITVKGGTEVPAGTSITEVGVFAGGQGGGGTLVAIDEFSAITVENGHTEEFTVPVDPSR